MENFLNEIIQKLQQYQQQVAVEAPQYIYKVATGAAATIDWSLLTLFTKQKK